MMRALTLFAALLMAAPAEATPRHEIGFELGLTPNVDDDFRLFSDGALMRSLGIRGGVAVWSLGEVIGLKVVGSWHRSWHGSTLFLGEDGDASLQSAFFADEFSLGPKVDVDFWHILYPYATVQGTLVSGLVKLDDDPLVDDNAGQVKGGALTGGVRVAGGIEVLVPHGRGPVAAALYTEVGYAFTGPMNFGELGDMEPGGGFALRTGVGLRF